MKLLMKLFNLLAIEMKKIQILMDKPVLVGLSILEISKIVMSEFWYDCVKTKYGEKANFTCYIDTDSFIVYIKTEDIYVDIAKDVETRLDTSNYEVDRPFPKGKNKTLIGLMTDGLSGKIIAEFALLRPKPCKKCIIGSSGTLCLLVTFE